MQMIDVMKRLAELDSSNPNVAQPTLESEKSLGTITNISESVSECGAPGMMGMSNVPASFSINASAQSGDEVANMISQIMNLAGVSKGNDLDVPAVPVSKEIELGEPHGVELDGGNDDMANMIGMIDKMNGDSTEPGGDVGGDDATGDDKESIENFGNQDGQQSPIADMADEVEDMAAELASLNSEEDEDESYDNSPDEKVKAHDYGDSQVTPKPQGFKQRVGDNPYKQVGESVDKVTLDLLKAYQEFKAQQ